MAIFIIWIILCFFAGAIASKKGRSSAGFFFLSFFLSPLVGIIGALIAKPNEEKVEKSKISEGNRKKCPFCAELIKTEAKICRYCNRELAESEEVDYILEQYSTKENNEEILTKGKKGYDLRHLIGILLFFIMIFYILNNYGDGLVDGAFEDLPRKVERNIDNNCIDFVELLSAEEVAIEMGKTASWVLANWKINLWEKPSASGKGRMIGQMYVGSHAKLIRKSGSDYLVVSPLDKSEGWVNKIQTKGIIKKNPVTLERCR